MQVIVAVSAGTNDPTQATLGMMAAKVAKEKGHEVVIWLQGEAAVIANRNVYGGIVGVNMPLMKDIVAALLTAKVPFWVCEACGKGRDVKPDNWVDTASYKTMGDYLAAALSFDKSLSF
jgi:predicted peroxiredoxin